MAGIMPGSEGDSIECWENYSASEVLVQGLAGQIHQQDVEAIVRAQKQMLQRFEKTNEMLSNCNALSASRFSTAHQEFNKHSSMLMQAKKDLDYIFKKIRILKAKIETQHPQTLSIAAHRYKEEEDDEPGSSSRGSSSNRHCSLDESSSTSAQFPAEDHAELRSPPGGEQLASDDVPCSEDEEAIKQGKVKRISGKLHHISSSDSSSSSIKSSYSSSDG